MIRHATLLSPRRARSPCEDIVEVVTPPGGPTMIVLADAAPYGGAAARAFSRRLNLAEPAALAVSHESVLAEFVMGEMAVLDEGEGGETSAILALIALDGTVTGASAGDSEAWIVGPGERVVVLTAGQRRKPRVGSGCVPVAFGPEPLDGGVLVLGSDGMFGWLAPHRIPLVAADAGGPADVPQALHAAALAANGGRLDDDFSCAAVWSDIEAPG